MNYEVLKRFLGRNLTTVWPWN